MADSREEFEKWIATAVGLGASSAYRTGALRAWLARDAEIAALRAERDAMYVDIGRRVLLERSLRAEVAKVRERCSEWALIAGEHGAEKDSLHAEVERLRKDAERSVGKTAARCREMAMWPQSIDDEQAYYGSMFAEFITKEFGAAIDAAMRQEGGG